MCTVLVSAEVRERFLLLSGHLLGNSCPLGWPFVLIVFCLFEIFIYFPFWVLEPDLVLDCSSSCSLLFYYFYNLLHWKGLLFDRTQ